MQFSKGLYAVLATAILFRPSHPTAQEMKQPTPAGAEIIINVKNSGSIKRWIISRLVPAGFTLEHESSLQVIVSTKILDEKNKKARATYTIIEDNGSIRLTLTAVTVYTNSSPTTTNERVVPFNKKEDYEGMQSLLDGLKRGIENVEKKRLAKGEPAPGPITASEIHNIVTCAAMEKSYNDGLVTLQNVVRLGGREPVEDEGAMARDMASHYRECQSSYQFNMTITILTKTAADGLCSSNNAGQLTEGIELYELCLQYSQDYMDKFVRPNTDTIDNPKKVEELYAQNVAERKQSIERCRARRNRVPF